MTSPFDRVKQKQAEERERWAKIRQLAAEQGYVLVRMSPRRYIVVRVEPSTGGVSSVRGFDGYYTHQTGEKVFGPDTWDECLSYIAENVKPLPPELSPQ